VEDAEREGTEEARGGEAREARGSEARGVMEADEDSEARGSDKMVEAHHWNLLLAC